MFWHCYCSSTLINWWEWDWTLRVHLNFTLVREVRAPDTSAGSKGQKSARMSFSCMSRAPRFPSTACPIPGNLSPCFIWAESMNMWLVSREQAGVITANKAKRAWRAAVTAGMFGRKSVICWESMSSWQEVKTGHDGFRSFDNPASSAVCLLICRQKLCKCFVSAWTLWPSLLALLRPSTPDHRSVSPALKSQ